MKLFLISQTENRDYDTYDSAVVCAPDEETARKVDPSGGSRRHTWASPCAVTVEYLGEARKAMPPGIVCASFNAG